MADFDKNETTIVQEEYQGVNFFDHLPDPILLSIFNQILDAKSLCRCLLVSKRFASLVTQVDSLYLELNHEKPRKPIGDSSILRSGSRSNSKSFIKNLFSKFISKPFQLIGQVVLGKKNGGFSSSNDCSIDVLKWVGGALRNFNEIQALKLELPCHGGETGVNKVISVLKWEAGFGKELDRCLILGANSIIERKDRVFNGGNDENGENSEMVFSDDELKLRIIWIISCLIASSSRHSLLKKVASDCPKLENAVISDAGGQGRLCVDAKQMRELRDSVKNSTNDGSPTSDSTSGMGPQMGNLVMKLWYVKELELPNCGYVMKGATLVVIRADDSKVSGEDKGKEDDELSLKGVFERDEVFCEAAKELVRRKEKRMYRLEMNAF